MNIFYTTGVSILFFLVSVITQFVVYSVSHFIDSLFRLLGAEFDKSIVYMMSYLILTLVGGWFAAFGCSKIYNNYHPVFILILPSGITLHAVFNGIFLINKNGISTVGIAFILVHFLGFCIFYYSLKKFYPSSLETSI